MKAGDHTIYSHLAARQCCGCEGGGEGDPPQGTPLVGTDMLCDYDRTGGRHLKGRPSNPHQQRKQGAVRGQREALPTLDVCLHEPWASPLPAGLPRGLPTSTIL